LILKLIITRITLRVT